MRPLFISDYQARIAALPEDRKKEIRILVTVNEKREYRKLVFHVPSVIRGEDRNLVRKYILAMMNNMMVSFAGADMTIYFDSADEVLAGVLKECVAKFQTENERNNRTGYGVYVNYTNRMNTFLGLGRFSMHCRDLEDWPDLSERTEYRIYVPKEEEKEVSLLRRSAVELDGRIFCSLDVGGNSIKGAVVKDGRVLVLKEYQWYPTGNRTAEEMNSPMILMVRFLSILTALSESERSSERIKRLLDRETGFGELLAFCAAAENAGIVSQRRFDSIVIGFPDIVVHNKIAGGESFKQLGMKNNPDLDYETEFFRTSSIDDLVRPYAKTGAPVVVLIDSNAASYIVSVEQAFSGESFLDENGIFCNTIGTEMGTAFISRGGTIQQIPLEGFQHVIDLDNEDSLYPADDIRSIRSRNTGIPGTVQKYISQMGLFRMTITALWEKDDPLFQEMLEKGMIEYDKEKDRMTAVISPKDMRGRLTRLLVSTLDDEKGAAAEAYRSMGRALGVLIDQDRMIFPEIAPVRVLSGGIISDDRAFRILKEGLKQHNPDYEVLRLDEDTMYSPLLRSMKPEERNFNVAVGSAYIGNRFLLEKE